LLNGFNEIASTLLLNLRFYPYRTFGVVWFGPEVHYSMFLRPVLAGLHD